MEITDPKPFDMYYFLEKDEQMNLKKIDWVIVGGESGRKPRPMDVDWVLDIQQQCEKAEVAFFFKQWGGTNKKKTGRMLNGRTYDDMPSLEHLETLQYGN